MSKIRWVVLLALVAIAAVMAGWTWDCRGTESVNQSASPAHVDGPSDGAEI